MFEGQGGGVEGHESFDDNSMPYALQIFDEYVLLEYFWKSNV